MTAIHTPELVFDHSTASEWPREHPIPIPSWWRGDDDRYRELLALRSQIAALEAVPVHMGWVAIVGAVVGVLGTANAGLAHAVGDSVALGRDWHFIAFGCLLLVLVSLWGCEAALSRRGRSFSLCSVLWGRLVHAVRDGMVDASGLDAWNPGETRIEKALRKEVMTALRCVEAGGVLKPRLNLFAVDVFGLARVGSRCCQDDLRA